MGGPNAVGSVAWYIWLMPAFTTLLGGGLAVFGGWLAKRQELQYADEIALRHETAKRRADAIRDGYVVAKEVNAFMVASTMACCEEYLISKEPWFWQNRVYLSGEYGQLWIDLRNAVGRAKLQEDYYERDKVTTNRFEELKDRSARIARLLEKEAARAAGVAELKGPRQNL